MQVMLWFERVGDGWRGADIAGIVAVALVVLLEPTRDNTGSTLDSAPVVVVLADCSGERYNGWTGGCRGGATSMSTTASTTWAYPLARAVNYTPRTVPVVVESGAAVVAASPQRQLAPSLAW